MFLSLSPLGAYLLPVRFETEDQTDPHETRCTVHEDVASSVGVPCSDAKLVGRCLPKEAGLDSEDTRCDTSLDLYWTPLKACLSLPFIGKELAWTGT
jgi:hypothetical protein